jgi:hypothetical protein
MRSFKRDKRMAKGEGHREGKSRFYRGKMRPRMRNLRGIRE